MSEFYRVFRQVDLQWHSVSFSHLRELCYVHILHVTVQAPSGSHRVWHRAIVVHTVSFESVETIVLYISTSQPSLDGEFQALSTLLRKFPQVSGLVNVRTHAEEDVLGERLWCKKKRKPTSDDGGTSPICTRLRMVSLRVRLLCVGNLSRSNRLCVAVQGEARGMRRA